MMTRAATLLCLLLIGAGNTVDPPSTASDPDRLGIEPLPPSFKRYHRAGFTKCTQVMAPNGKPIRIIAQPQVRDIAVARARNLLIFFLTDVPGSRWGASKKDVANTMADHGAVLAMPAGGHIPGREPRLHAQPLFQDETPVDGSRWYIQNDWEHRDAALEEIFHLVHDAGIGTDVVGARPAYQQALLAEARAALRDGRWGIAVEPDVRDWIEELDEENSLAQEYIASVLDTYYGLWAAFDERPGGMWGIYIAKTRDELARKDPAGQALIEAFLPPMMVGYEALIDPEFQGTFQLTHDPDLPYTHKSQYLVEARLTGTNNAGLAGNEADNRLGGNRGNNQLDGRGGNDTALFAGPVGDYTIDLADDGTLIVTDRVAGRDGTDRLRSIEQLEFAGTTIPAPAPQP
jgi:hypothetical protein